MQRLLFIIVLLVMYSCDCDDTEYLSEDVVALYPYENTESVSFIDSSQNLVLFENITYDRDIYENSSPPVFFYTGQNCRKSYEQIVVSMRSESDYELYVSTGPGFKAAVVDPTIGYFEFEENEYINYSFYDVTYDDALRMYSNYHDSEIILIPDLGIVSIQYGYQEYMPELWQSFILEN